MTREEAISEVQLYARCINRDKYLEQVVNKIYNDREAQLKLASDVYSTDKMHMYQELKAKDKITQDIKEAYELKSIAYDLLLEAIKLKDEEIERLKEHITHLQNVYMKLDGKYLKLKTELE